MASSLVIKDGIASSSVEVVVPPSVLQGLGLLPGQVVECESGTEQRCWGRVTCSEDMRGAVCVVSQQLLQQARLCVGQRLRLSLPVAPLTAARSARVLTAPHSASDFAYVAWALAGTPIWSGCSCVVSRAGRRVVLQLDRVEPSPSLMALDTAIAVASPAVDGLSNAVAAAPPLYGVEHHSRQILRVVRWALSRQSHAPHGLLLHGPPGSGKTALARWTAQKAGVAIVAASGGSGDRSFIGAAAEAVREMGRKAIASAPSVLIVDEVDGLLVSSDATGADDAGRALEGGMAALMELLDRLGADALPVAVIAICNRPDRLPLALRRSGRLEVELEISELDRDARLEMLRGLLGKDAVPNDLVLPGMVAGDLAALASEAAVLASLRGAPHAAEEDVVNALRRVQSASSRGWEVEVPEVKMDAVGGMAEVKQRLYECIEWPIKRADAFARLGIKPSSGILLYGPPGNGKTMIARAVASQFSCSFLLVKGPELFSKYVGESERALAKVFAQARRMHPCVVFLDEIDALAPKRGSSPASVSDRMLSTLLSQLDGVSPLKGVTVIAATNRPDHLDPALLRPGRLTHLLYVPLPDAAARTSIFWSLLSDVPREEALTSEAISKFAEDDCDGCSGAECSGIVREAKLHALLRPGDPVVAMQDLRYGREVCPPRISQESLKFYEQWKP